MVGRNIRLNRSMRRICKLECFLRPYATRLINSVGDFLWGSRESETEKHVIGWNKGTRGNRKSWSEYGWTWKIWHCLEDLAGEWQEQEGQVGRGVAGKILQEKSFQESVNQSILLLIKPSNILSNTIVNQSILLLINPSNILIEVTQFL